MIGLIPHPNSAEDSDTPQCCSQEVPPHMSEMPAEINSILPCQEAFLTDPPHPNTHPTGGSRLRACADWTLDARYRLFPALVRSARLALSTSHGSWLSTTVPQWVDLCTKFPQRAVA